MDFWVCEKSDGLRVLVFVVMNQGSGQQETWLVSPLPAGRPPDREAIVLLGQLILELS
jgi:hypothetical protein